MKHHDDLRRIFAEHGLRTSDGRPASEMTDEDVEAVLRAIVRAATEFGRKVREEIVPAIERVTITLNRVLEPIRSNPALMAEIERRHRERA